MPDILRAFLERAADAGKPGDSIRFIASTSNTARDGMIIEADGWVLDNFRANPTFLWAHNYSEPPIGKVTNIEIDGDQLLADVSFDQSDDFAMRIERKYRSGMLNAVSVGFDIKEFAPAKGDNPTPRVTKAELLELSAVPVPADPGALSQLQSRAYRKIGQELLDAIPDDDDGENVTTATTTTRADDAARLSWPDTAAAMAGLFQPYSQRPDDERRTEYQRLTRDYARHKKTPPDFASNAELEALDDDTLRGLFFEGEPELLPDHFARMYSRAGQVLSKRNRDDIDQAIALLTAVKERAQKEADDAAKSDEERQTQAALEQVAAMLKGDAK